MSSTRPIGVFDSGVGGLSILDKIHRLLPGEQLLYVADSANAPYGGRPAAWINERCEEILAFFLRRRVKAVVLACNTATAAAVGHLRERHALPIIGVEPALKPAAEQSRSGVVGVLATAGTLDSDKFSHLHNRFRHRVEVITRACPGLVEEIERPEPDGAALDALLREFCAPMLARGADTLVLGCTHYSLISERIAVLAGPGVRIVDTGFAVARELQRRLEQADLLGGGGQGGVSFFTSGDARAQAPLIARYWGSAVEVASLAAQEQAV